MPGYVYRVENSREASGGPAGGCTRRPTRVGKPGFQDSTSDLSWTPERHISRDEVRFFTRPVADAVIQTS